MWSFKNDYLRRQNYGFAITQMVSRVTNYHGKEELYKQQQPEVLEHLQKVAVIQSTESSNRIEGIEMDATHLERFLSEKLEPKNRSEAEILGYRDVLDTIHANAANIPIKPRYILQLHRDLLKNLSTSMGGRWKMADNDITELHPDGTRVVRFRPLPASQVPTAMDELCNRFLYERDRGEIPELILIGAFVFDFLSIHPFMDGNGRMARLLTLLLLYQSGYIVGKYISLEKVVEDTKDSYYETLHKSSQGWHTGEHDLMPWLQYFLSVMLKAYDRFEERVSVQLHPKGRKWKAERVRSVVDHMLVDRFTVQEIEDKCPGISRSTVMKTLNQLREEGIVECIGRGPKSKWRKINL